MYLSYRIASPFLDVLEEILNDEDHDDQEDEQDEDELMSTEEVEENYNNMMRCLSGQIFPENEDDGVGDAEEEEEEEEEVDDEEEVNDEEEVDDNEVDDNESSSESSVIWSWKLVQIIM